MSRGGSRHSGDCLHGYRIGYCDKCEIKRLNAEVERQRRYISEKGLYYAKLFSEMKEKLDDWWTINALDPFHKGTLDFMWPNGEIKYGLKWLDDVELYHVRPIFWRVSVKGGEAHE
jgi:hypothetical protein